MAPPRTTCPRKCNSTPPGCSRLGRQGRNAPSYRPLHLTGAAGRCQSPHRPLRPRPESFHWFSEVTMKTQLLLVATVGLLLGADNPQDAASKKDLQGLQGTWK